MQVEEPQVEEPEDMAMEEPTGDQSAMVEVEAADDESGEQKPKRKRTRRGSRGGRGRKKTTTAASTEGAPSSES